MICLKCATPISSSESPTHGMHAACFTAEFGVEQTADFSDLFEQATQSGPREAKGLAFRRFNSSFFQGRYRKYSATLGGGNYILKMQQPEYPELPAIESICNQVARILGLQIPDFHYITFKNQTPTFVSRNFMDQFSPATLDHIYKFLEPNDEFTCEVLCKIVQSQTGRLSDVHRFVEICLFDALIGNNDRHGRNLGFITRSAGIRTLSPFYDNPSYIGIADEVLLESDIQPRGTILTPLSTEPLMSDYITEFRRLELDSAVDRFKQKALSRTQTIVEAIECFPSITERRKIALIGLVEKRVQELENA
jgi:hypothetical protein